MVNQFRHIKQFALFYSNNDKVKCEQFESIKRFKNISENNRARFLLDQSAARNYINASFKQVFWILFFLNFIIQTYFKFDETICTHPCKINLF